MLSKRRCPHTGIVNFYALADPHVAIGSVTQTGKLTRYAWRCYIDDEAGGLAPNVATAEDRLRREIARRDPSVYRMAS
jgi:hypothetical protein